MMQLKLLGILQDFGSPYASLYINEVNGIMYLAIEQERHESNIFSALLLRVTSIMINDYMQNMIGLRRLSELSKERYIWNRSKGDKGHLISIEQNIDIKNCIDILDDMFDAEFCRNEIFIRYYIKQNQ
jgi:hypothetical protein